ncbi:MAG: Mth938-like domain-containing protein [Hyphomicrobiaceae bacterium]
MASVLSRTNARYPGRAPIDSYGNGGFRFAQMSHRGSLLCLPCGVFAWDVDVDAQVSLALLEPVLAQLQPPAFLLFGTGTRQVFPTTDIRAAFVEAGVGLETMSTGAACRTYNILLGEGRPVAAALVAVA